MSLRANSFLSTAEPVQCISGSGSAELSNVLFADSGNSSDCALHESVMPVSSSLRSPTTQTEETGFRASTVSSTAVDRTDPGSSTSLLENEHSHINSLLRSLPSDLTDEQYDHAEAFIRSQVPFRGRSTTLAVLASSRIALTRVITVLTLSNCDVTHRPSFRSLTNMCKICLSTMSLSLLLRHGVLMW